MNNPLTIGEVMESLRRITMFIRDETEGVVRAETQNPARQDLAVLALIEKYAPEMVQREAEEAAGERMVRVALTQ